MKHRLAAILPLLLIFLVACIPSNKALPTQAALSITPYNSAVTPAEGIRVGITGSPTTASQAKPPIQTRTPKPTKTPTSTPLPTLTPFPPYATKQILLDYYTNGFHSIYESILDSSYSKLVLYTDGQLIVSGKTYQQKMLTEKEKNQLLSKLEAYGYTNNKLSSITNCNQQVTYQYNGLGERVSQTVNGVTTNYVLDQAAGLTQVLSDGTNTYLYGNDRIAQYNNGGSTYFLTDALGSVRQLVDSSGTITLTKAYDPYGEVLNSTGSGSSSYGFTGEATSQGLIFLRARYYSPVDGRFLTRDSWNGNYTKPLSLNKWLYGYSNPVMNVDPSGQISCFIISSAECENRALSLKNLALEYKGKVREGNEGIQPVEAFTKLASDAYRLFDHDTLGTMWGLTNVLVGIDPNVTFTKH